MATRDARIDIYIGKAAPFARPVLNHLRTVVHKACPEVQETIKWGMPTFDYNGIVCGIAAFKEHCALWFWKARLMPDPHRVFPKTKEAMGNLGKIRGLPDLPSDRILISYIKVAVKLNEEGVNRPARGKRGKDKPLKVPPILAASFRKDKKAKKKFDSFTPSQQRDYVEWITEARTDVTRMKRAATAVKWMAEGKVRNWRYMKS